MATFFVLTLVMGLYAGYNVLIKVSTGHVPDAATTTVLATLSLQVTALMVSLAFAGVLGAQGGHVFRLGVASYGWAAAAGLCIGAAEIAYFYLFAGIGHGAPMAANVAVPVVVGGAIAITLLISALALREPLSWSQAGGAALVIVGVAVLFLGPR